MAMEFHGGNLIGGVCSKLGNGQFHAMNPATQETLEPAFHGATEQEVSAALVAATEAFGIYRRKSAEEIAGLLEQIAAEILALGDVLIKRAHAETALPEARLNGERTRTVDQLKLFAQTVREGSWVDARIDRAMPDRKPLPKPDLRRMNLPIGPVVVFGASNFPLAFSVAGGDTASALAAGNTVVVKAHPAHPGTSELAAAAIQTALEKCGMPPGVFSMLQSTRPAIGQALARHPLTRAVAFTGSLKAGRALFDAVRERPVPIPCFCEMGSTNPVFVLPNAVRERGAEIAKGLVQSVTLGAGQFCTNPGVVIGLDDENLKTFIDAAARLIEQAPPGVMLHKGVCEGYRDGVQRAKAVPGVNVAGVSSAPVQRDMLQALPAILETDARTFLAKPELAEEVFGPMTLVVRCGSVAELNEIAAHLSGQLTVTLHGTEKDFKDFGHLVDILSDRAGRLLVNGFPTGVEVCASMHHGGPYPATTDASATSVGTAAIRRFSHPVCFQNFPQSLLPLELQDKNERQIWRLVDGEMTKS